jgi:hypothetical protein
MENKKGRKPYPVEMRCVTTSLRLRPDRLAKYKELGGVQWLNGMLDMIKKDKEHGELNESTNSY